MQTDNMYCQPKLVQSCTFCHLIKFTRNQTEHLTLEGHKKYLAAEWKATCPYKNVCQLKLGKKVKAITKVFHDKPWGSIIYPLCSIKIIILSVLLRSKHTKNNNKKVKTVSSFLVNFKFLFCNKISKNFPKLEIFETADPLKTFWVLQNFKKWQFSLLMS